jgi:cytochrome oxidase Cu insertion factor (SCO1/SenC/PrrC family)
MRSSRFLLSMWMVLASACVAAAQQNNLPRLARGVTIEQKLNSAIPLDLVFRDESNHVLPLRTYFGDKPVVLALVYYGCPNLCSFTLTEMVHALHRLSFEPGRDYDVVVVSFDPSEKGGIRERVRAPLVQLGLALSDRDARLDIAAGLSCWVQVPVG